jgi:hypothetical protein
VLLIEGQIDFTMVANAGGTGDIYASTPVTIVTGIFDVGQEVAATAAAFLVNSISSINKMNFYNIYPISNIPDTDGRHYQAGFKYIY